MYCKICGDSDESNFYKTNKSTCKRCIISKVKRPPAVPKPYLCSACGATDPELFYRNVKGKCKKCASAQVGYRYHQLSPEDKKQYHDNVRAWQNSNLLYYRWMSARNRAKQKGTEFLITVQDVESLWEQQQGLCYYSGLVMGLEVEVSNSPSTNAVSIDRLDSSIGYVNGNIVLCCASVNVMKNALSIDQLKQLVDALYVRRELY